ncbi:hypothetical protein BGX28_006014 [Mortierella sp. GBA30]|nr:hypothetical protein BGX28_006014 [Mortierella sp. GBA30]
MNTTQQHSLESCPLRDFGCITTTDTPPYRILDLDLGALDLFLARQDHMHHYNDHKQQLLVRTKALDFLRGLNLSDVLLPDTESCLFPAFTALPATTLEDSTKQSYIVSEDAILFQNNQLDPDLSLKLTPRRVHACIHHSPFSTQSYSLSHSSNIGSNSSSKKISGCRHYLVKDVTEMHTLALAARNGIRASGRLAQRQQSFTTRHIPSKNNRRHYKQQQRQQEQVSTIPVLRSRDSGIMLVDDTWSNSQKTDDHSTDIETSNAVSVSKPTMTPIQDPGLLIIQVTRFGTVDHAFAIPQSDDKERRRTSERALSLSTDDDAEYDSEDDDDDGDTKPLLFLAHDQAAIEAMASNAVMIYVHPQELTALCRGLDQVCKTLYTVFRARWRVDALPLQGLLSTTEVDCPQDQDDGAHDNEDDDACSEAKSEGGTIIEFQGEKFEEWVDPTAAAATVVSSVGQNPLGLSEDDRVVEIKYAWTEITGVLSNGNPVLVVRPLTMPEVEEQESLLASSSSSSSSVNVLPSTSKICQGPLLYDSDPVPAFVNAEGDFEDRYLAREMDLDSLCSERTILQEEEGDSRANWKTQTNCIRRRMDLEEGLSLCKNNSGTRHISKLSDLGSLTSNGNTSVSKSRSVSRSKNLGRHSGRGRPLVISFLPTAAASDLVLCSWPVLTSIALDAWRQWVEVIYLTKEQFQAWSEYLLDLALGQMIETVSLGLTVLGCDPRPVLPSTPSSLPSSSLSMCCSLHELTEDMNEPDHQKRLCQTVVTTRTIHQETSVHQVKLSGLDRAGKVLEANYPGLECVVRQIGKSWLGHRIMATVQLEQKLDIVADQVVDWWESGDRVATLASSVPIPAPLSPLLTTLTAYTPLSSLSSRIISVRQQKQKATSE